MELDVKSWGYFACLLPDVSTERFTTPYNVIKCRARKTLCYKIVETCSGL